MNEQISQEKPKGGVILKLVVIIAIIAAGVVIAQNLMQGTKSDATEAAVAEPHSAPADQIRETTGEMAGGQMDEEEKTRVKALLQSLSIAARQNDQEEADEAEEIKAALEKVPDEKRETVAALQETIGTMRDDPAKRAQLLEFLKVLQEEDDQRGEQISLEELLTRLEAADIN